MEYGGWEVKLEEWNGGVTVADFWPSARRLEELQEAAEQRRRIMRWRCRSTHEQQARGMLRTSVRAASGAEGCTGGV